jgi:alkylation response protein AidB-like acyl-CoA dehydrogenase
VNTFLSDSDVALLEKYRDFAVQYLTRPNVEDGYGQTDRQELFKHLAAAQLLGITIPEKYSGKGGTFFEVVLLAQALGGSDGGISLILASHVAVAELILKFGSEIQKARFLPQLARGEIIGTLAYAEDQAALVPDLVNTGVYKIGENLYLEGVKRVVVNAESSGLLVVLANQDGGQKPGFWLIDNPGIKGIAVQPEAIFGLRSSSPGTVTFTSLQVSEADRLSTTAGGVAEIGSQLDVVLAVMRTIVSAAAVGMVEAELKAAVDFSRNNKRQGRLLGDSQAIQWKLADQATECSAASLLTYRAAWSKDQAPQEFIKNAAMCKFHASRVARIFSGENVQIFGATEPEAVQRLERCYRDAKMFEITPTTSEEDKSTIGRELDL